MKTTVPLLTLTLTLTITTLLTACGGGGGSSTTPGSTLYTAACSDGTSQVSTISMADATAVCAVATTIYASNIVTTVPADTYNAVTQAEEKAAFNLLNAERSACGFGKLAQNPLLDTAARGHADWQQLNFASGHYQTAGTIGFTGVNPIGRLSAAGYIGSSANDDISSRLGINNKTGYGYITIYGLLAAPYHSISLLGEQRDIGISIRNATDSGSTNGARIVAQINTSYTSAASYQAPASSDVLTYPCQGTTGVDYSLDGESPNPVPGRNLIAQPLGHPIIIMARKGRWLTISSATMTKVSTGATVTLRTPVTNATDPNGSGYYAGNFGYVLPDAALEPSTQYQVTVNGLSGATAFSRTFTFTTGAVNY